MHNGRFDKLESKLDDLKSCISNGLSKKADKKMVYTLFGTTITLFGLIAGMLWRM